MKNNLIMFGFQKKMEGKYKEKKIEMKNKMK